MSSHVTSTLVYGMEITGDILTSLADCYGAIDELVDTGLPGALKDLGAKEGQLQVFINEQNGDHDYPRQVDSIVVGIPLNINDLPTDIVEARKKFEDAFTVEAAEAIPQAILDQYEKELEFEWEGGAPEIGPVKHHIVVSVFHDEHEDMEYC